MPCKRLQICTRLVHVLTKGYAVRLTIFLDATGRCLVLKRYSAISFWNADGPWEPFLASGRAMLPRIE